MHKHTLKVFYTRELHGDGANGVLAWARGYGNEVHGLTAGMGPTIWGHHGDGLNNLQDTAVFLYIW